MCLNSYTWLDIAGVHLLLFDVFTTLLRTLSGACALKSAISPGYRNNNLSFRLEKVVLHHHRAHYSCGEKNRSFVRLSFPHDRLLDDILWTVDCKCPTYNTPNWVTYDPVPVRKSLWDTGAAVGIAAAGHSSGGSASSMRMKVQRFVQTVEHTWWRIRKAVQ